MRAPSSTPGGMRTCRVRCFLTMPLPWQLGQGSVIMRPWPPQRGQVRSMAKKPCEARTRPAPPQVEQVWGLEPSLQPEPWHGSQVRAAGTVISTSAPE